MDFVSCVTGSPNCQGNVIHVDFSADPESPAFSFHTCPKQLTISENIQSEESFRVGLKAVLTKDFTTT